MIFCLNGKFVEEKDAKISVLDHGFLYSDGFYDTMKAFNGKILDLEKHLKRVERSLKKLSLPLPWSSKTLGDWIKKTAALNQHELTRIRMTITRGVNNFNFNTAKNPTVVIIAEPIEIDPVIYKKGVKVITFPMVRIMPEIKIMGVTGMILSRSEIEKKKCFEALFVNEGYVREGSITNIFLIKKGILYTPKSKILPGITRDEVLHVAKMNKIKVKIEDIKIHKLFTADEIFLTNTKFGITPVIRVDSQKIGNGKVGSITQKMMVLFNNYVENHITHA